MNWISSNYQRFEKKSRFGPIFVSTRVDKKNQMIFCSSRYFLEIGGIDGKTASNYEMSHGGIRALKCHMAELGALIPLQMPSWPLRRPPSITRQFWNLRMMVCWARSISDFILIVVIFGQNMIPTFEGNEQGIKNSLSTQTGNLRCYVDVWSQAEICQD